MPRWSARRGQVDPLAALVAVAVLGLALAGAGLAFEVATPETAARDLARPALERVLEAVRPASVAVPGRLPRAEAAAPEGYRLNATLTTGGERWSVGPAAPTDARAAATPVPVRTAPSTVRSGRLRVVVWR